MSQQMSIVIFVGALILFVNYRRIRRNIGWQELRQGNLIARMIIFLVIGSIFTYGAVFKPVSLISDLAGIMIGAILAYYGANVTNFEHRNGRLFYRPNTWIGSAVTLIFLGRLFYRFYSLYTQGDISTAQQGQPADYQNVSAVMGNSWTAGLMLIMIAYYIIYYILLLRKQKQLVQVD